MTEILKDYMTPDGFHRLESFGYVPGDNNLVTVKCNHCDNQVEIEKGLIRIFKGVACDSCDEEYDKNTDMKRYVERWRVISPRGGLFDQTDKNHPDFPITALRAILAALKANPKQSFIIHGSKGKTRLMMYVLKLLISKNISVDVVWPEDVADAVYARNKKFLMVQYGKPHMLGIDDAFPTGGRDQKVMDFIHGIIDYRKRYDRPIIVSSDLVYDSYEEGVGKYGDFAPWQIKRVKTLNSKLSEYCLKINTEDTGESESPF